jgi:hypothetical protein
MGSISNNDYDAMVEELNVNLKNVLKINQQYFKNILEDGIETDYVEYIGLLDVPKKCYFIQGISLHNYKKGKKTEVWICWNHYILMKLSHWQLRKKLRSALEYQVGWKLVPLQRKWREIYYHPEGAFMEKHGRAIAERNGMMY